MFAYHSLLEGVEELVREHAQCSGISENGVGEQETHSTNAVGNVAKGATVGLEEIPSHSSTK